MRILFTTPILEYPAVGGPQLRIENSIKALARVCELDLISRYSGYADESDQTHAYFQSYAGEYHILDRSKIKGKFSAFPLLEKVMNRLFDTRTDAHVEYILAHLDRREISIVWFGYGNISFPLIRKLKQARPSLKVVCDTDSVWSRFVLRELPYIKGLRKLKVWIEGKRKEVEELAWVNLSDVTTAVSEVDAVYYRGIAGNPAAVHVFSNVIDTAVYKDRPPVPAGFKAPCIYLAGSFDGKNSPMDTAARWVLDEVFPLVLERHPNLHFYIVGRNSEIGFGHLAGPNITVTGRLDTVLPYLCNADISLVPLKFESGTRFKILEAGACHVPLVSTTLGAEGIPVVDGKHILLADDPADFATAIMKLLDDKALAASLADNCQLLVNDMFSIEALVSEARSILEYLGAKLPA
jgi:glycosyltransferase involved in cell wall biosynthesis